MNAPRPAQDCVCDGQADLTDLVDTEHIDGSMPAATTERDAARDTFYTALADIVRASRPTHQDHP